MLGHKNQGSTPIFARGMRPPVFPLVLGVIVGQVVAWVAPLIVAMTAISTLGGVALIAPRRLRGFLSGALLGVVTCASALIVADKGIESEDAQLLVRVEGAPSRRSPGEVVFFGRELVGGHHLIRCRSVELPWRNGGALSEGDTLWVRGAITPVARPLNPFSWAAWLWRKGVSGEMKVLFASAPLHHAPSAIATMRSMVAERVRALTDESRGGDLFLSMAFGFRDVNSRPVEDTFKGLGLSHLLVVSGYQVSLVFGVVYALMMLVASRGLATVWSRNVAAALSLIVAGCYVVLVGMEMSAIRALIAASCMCAHLVLDRRSHFFQSLGVALIMVHLITPWAMFDIGVLLTFAALAGIGVASILGGASRLKGLLWVTFCVWVNTSLVILLWNGGFSIAGLFLNLVLAAPWSIVNCTVGVIGFVLSFLQQEVGAWIVRGVAWINEGVVATLMASSQHLGELQEFQGVVRYVASLALALLAIGLVRSAASRRGVSAIRALVR